MRTILVSFFVFLTVLASTYFAYQEWMKNQDYFDFSNVQTLSETSKIQSISAPQGKRLVPQGAILGINDVDEIYYTYFVDVEEGKNLDVTVSRAFFEKNEIIYEDTYGLLDFDINLEIISDSQVRVSVTVSLNMPDTQELAEMIYGSHASFQLHFAQID